MLSWFAKHVVGASIGPTGILWEPPKGILINLRFNITSPCDGGGERGGGGGGGLSTDCLSH